MQKIAEDLAHSGILILDPGWKLENCPPFPSRQGTMGEESRRKDILSISVLNLPDFLLSREKVAADLGHS